MNIIVTGGGTGGHIYPAIAIAHEFIKNKDRVLYVGKKNGLEEELVKRESIDFEPITAKGFPRKKFSVGSFSSAASLFMGMNQSSKILKRFSPDAVIGTGGYVCAPIVLKAQQKNIRTYLQEQNAYPGKANRFLAKNANRIFISFSEAKKYFPNNSCEKFGNPIRNDFCNVNPVEFKNSHNIKLGKKVVFSLGGSGGQESTNDAIRQMLSKELDFTLIHVTGRDHYDKFMKGLKLDEDVKIMDYCNDVAGYMSVSDLVIASSSAITLAEISYLSKASILIPKSYTAGNHQYYNAMSYKDNEACRVILEDNLNSNTLLDEINEILADDDLRETLGKNSKKMAEFDSAKKIVDYIKQDG